MRQFCHVEAQIVLGVISIAIREPGVSVGLIWLKSTLFYRQLSH